MIEIARIGPDFATWENLLSLILSSFGYMNGVIDPPSSALGLTTESLRSKAETEIAFVARAEGALAGCVFLRTEPDCLYIGKLAVDPGRQGKGIGRCLLATAEDTARTLHLPQLRLETRIELVGNHSRFAAWGFRRTAEKSHAGYDRVTFVEMRKVL